MSALCGQYGQAGASARQECLPPPSLLGGQPRCPRVHGGDCRAAHGQLAPSQGPGSQHWVHFGDCYLRLVHVKHGGILSATFTTGRGNHGKAQELAPFCTRHYSAVLCARTHRYNLREFFLPSWQREHEQAVLALFRIALECGHTSWLANGYIGKRT
jgi:hypothetical protein